MCVYTYAHTRYLSLFPTGFCFYIVLSFYMYFITPFFSFPSDSQDFETSTVFPRRQLRNLDFDSTPATSLHRLHLTDYKMGGV